MRLIKVAAAVLNTTPLDWEGNKLRILAALRDARSQGVSILCLPELCISGYGCEDAFHASSVPATAWEVLQEILPETRGLMASVGLPLRYQNSLFNTACLLADGQVVGFVAKQHLAGEGIHYEPRWFKPWPHGLQQEVRFDGGEYPLGDIYFDCAGVKLGFEICEDAWVARRPGGDLASRGVDLILNPSASHFAFGKHDVRKRFVLEGSRAFNVGYIYSNLLGNEAGRAIYDGGGLIASCGHLLAAGPRFSFADHHLTTAILDVESSQMNRSRSTTFQPDLKGDRADCIPVDFVFPHQDPEADAEAAPCWESGSHVKEEEFTRAVSLGLFDYMRKSHSRGFVVSLSGGTDSSGVACLVRTMVQLGVRELGAEGFKQRQGFDIGLPADEDALTRSLLLCAYQKTRNSSTTTHDAAKQVAQAIGAEFLVLDVDEIVHDYVDLISQAVGRGITWEQDDIARQNIQARARGPSIWMLANIKQALLLATSNRSEAAVGYTTMDGDTCGGLSPIAGIDKTFLKAWLKWMETVGPLGLSAIPALAAVTRQIPTAELRPPEEEQQDEKDLMPYELLDAIEKAAIRDKRTPTEVYKLMRPVFPAYSSQQLGQWVERFFRLWCRNQWKRERYAPSFHLDDENLDPKTWCRFPILSGGFERELALMWRVIGTDDQGGPSQQADSSPPQTAATRAKP